MTTEAFTFHIEPLGMEQYREELVELAARFTNYWAGITYPARLLTRARRFSFAPVRQQLRQQLRPLDDARAALAVLQDGTSTATDRQQAVAPRLSTLQRVCRTVHAAETVQAALLALAQGATDAATVARVTEGLQQAIWRWRWIKNYRRMYETVDSVLRPLAIDHYYVCWPEEYTNAEALRSVLKQTFLLPEVTQAPLPALFSGTYQAEATQLAPTAPGQPWLRVLHAWDVRGEWHLGSLRELLMQDMELTLAIDVQTLSRAKALRATQNAHTTLREAVYGKHAVKDARSERAFLDVEYAMHQLDTQALHEVAIAVLLQAPTLRELDTQTQTLRDLLGARMRLDVLAGAQADYLRLFTEQPAQALTAPLIRRNGLSENVAVKMPWGLRKTTRTAGIAWGMNPYEGMLIHADLFGVRGTDNPHLMMLGKSGSGKTVSLNMLALRQAVAGHQVVFFDPVGKCEWLCEAVGAGASYAELARDVAINILDPVSDDLARQSAHVRRLLALVLGEESGDGITPRRLTNNERGALDRALADARVYGPDGARLATMDAETAPLLGTLVTVLGEGSAIAQALATEITDVALLSRAGVFNQPTALRWIFDRDVVCYNLNNADPALLPLYLAHGFQAINRYVRSPQRRQRGQKLILILDEFGLLSRIEGMQEEISYDTKEWRNYGAAVWTCDQNASTYVGNGSASEFSNRTANNTAIKLIGRQEGSDVPLLAEAYGNLLAPSDLAAIRTAGPGEFVAIFGSNEVHHLRMELTDQEAPFFIRHT